MTAEKTSRTGRAKWRPVEHPASDLAECFVVRRANNGSLYVELTKSVYFAASGFVHSGVVAWMPLPALPSLKEMQQWHQ